MLGAAGWVVQDIRGLYLSASREVAVREMQSLGGPAGCVLFVDAVGVTSSDKAALAGFGAVEQAPALEG
ncbi:hypothetical protein HZ994_17465 [Akkermansiaceae bacterium]|nr:hypothetical protein HZ994_17465 [Akkermansiaceae bacterium]